MKKLSLFLAAIFALAPIHLHAQTAADLSLFSQGRTRFSVSGGYGNYGGNGYFVLGGGAGYYLLDGLELGVDGQAYLGAKPHIYKVSPEMRYVLDIPQFKPYAGVFYQRTFFDQLKALDALGARAGLLFPLGSHAYASGGIVYERQLHCDSALYSTCSQVYPELGFALSY